MTSYEAGAAGVALLGVKAVTYQIRLIRFEFFTSSSATTVTFSRYSGISFSGGATVTPLPFRADAAASVVTAKSGATVSGTQSIFIVQSGGSASGGALVSYTPPGDVILAPGDGLWLNTSQVGQWADICYEELHLARSV